MKRYQATPKWELERSLRQAALRRGVLLGAGAAMVGLAIWFVLVLLFTL